ncbi:MAG: phosphoglucosamine mutase [Micavibrio sp.]|nr:phosphoglucosamine mutase [Micavibrio sp.]
MARKYFGTDGIRGRTNKFPMTAEMALKVAMATALSLQHDHLGLHQNRVVIGKDTRLSGYMLEEAMAAGFVAMGMEVILLGPIPTPGVAMLTRSLRADVGVMISASHNQYEDNGIKLFGSDGYKIPDALEEAIEGRMDQDLSDELPEPDLIGKARRMDDALGRYVEFLKSSFPRGLSLDGLKIVVDCAHGAAYKVAPQVLWELEAEVVPMGVYPNGRNINAGCGATATEALQERVVSEKADLGIALDGDADRLIMVDEKGRRIDGDQLMALLGQKWHEDGRLRGGGVAATVMSNLGLERYLKTRGLTLARTPVGDRHVVERMRADGFNLGGEQSGHIIMSDFGTTGDGMMAALQILAVLKQQSYPASTALNVFTPLPQILQNVRFASGAKPLESEAVKEAIAKAEKSLANDGRLLVRPSGTEPLIRVMAEGDDAAKVKSIVDDLCAVIEKAGS